MARRPDFDLASLTAEAAEPMREAAQRAAKLAPTVTSATPHSVKPRTVTDPAMAEKVKTADLEPLTFKVAPVFRKRFRQRAHDAELKLNELLFEALAAWEEKHGFKR